MPLLQDFGKIARVSARTTRAVVRGVRTTATTTTRATRWVGRNVGSARRIGGAGNVGMMRLLDLHAISCAGDTLVTIGLAGTIFFSVPAGEARGRVGLYLLVTMVPFALLAPVVGPLLDRFRHGRRYALAATMLGRAVLAWIIAANVVGFGLYPAAFGVLALSRAYGVARSAAVPRLLPRGMGLSQAGARASVWGTVAGAVMAPVGALLFLVGEAWPLRLASLVFAVGVVVSLALPPKADADPPEVVPKIFQIPWRHRAENGEAILTGPVVVGALIGSACLRALYGFLLLFLAFAIRAGDAPIRFAGIDFSEAGALGLIGGALALGTFASTAIGTGLKILRPLRLQAFGFGVVALAGAWAALSYTLTSLIAFCLATALASGLAKLAVDASIQDRAPETVRASAFAHAETLLMLAWVAGGAAGLIPFDGRAGIAVAALAMVAALARGVVVAYRARGDALGRPRLAVPAPAAPPTVPPPAPVAVTAAESTVDDEAPPGYHIFRPSPPDVAEPR